METHKNENSCNNENRNAWFVHIGKKDSVPVVKPCHFLSKVGSELEISITGEPEDRNG